MGTGVLSRGYSGRRLRLTTQIHLVPRLRINGAVPLFPLYAFMVWTETTLPFIFYGSTAAGMKTCPMWIILWKFGRFLYYYRLQNICLNKWVSFNQDRNQRRLLCIWNRNELRLWKVVPFVTIWATVRLSVTLLHGVRYLSGLKNSFTGNVL
jgi:hypothetical protein